MSLKPRVLKRHPLFLHNLGQLLIESIECSKLAVSEFLVGDTAQAA
jgi:hypothetical protein